jgi:hypothetical protein
MTNKMLTVSQINQIVKMITAAHAFGNNMVSVLSRFKNSLFSVIDYSVVPGCVFGVIKHV